MPAPFQMPGYYWDEAQQRFFKVEKTGTAPEGARWAQAQARQRQREQTRRHEAEGRSRKRRQLAGAQQQQHQQQHQQQQQPPPAVPPVPIARAPPPTRSSGLLAASCLQREIGGGPCSSSSSSTRSAQSSSMRAAAAAALAGGFCYRGGIDTTARLWIQDTVSREDVRRRMCGIKCLYVNGDDERSGLGVMYTNYFSSDEFAANIKGWYIAPDKDERISNRWPTRGRHRFYDYRFGRTEPENLDVLDPSAICYHRASDRMMATSRQMAAHSGTCMCVWSPVRVAAAAEDGHGRHGRRGMAPEWRLGSSARTADSSVIRVTGRGARGAIYSCAPAPPAAGSNGTFCVVGTGGGIAVLDLRGLSAGRPQLADFFTAFPPGGNVSSSSSSSLVSTVDFFEGHPQLVLAGGRWRTPWLVDLRAPTHRRWHTLGGGSSSSSSEETNAVAHVRSVGGHRVVAAGLRDTMLLYDVRYVQSTTSASQQQKQQHGRALLRFDGYRNASRLLGTGFDVAPELGLVAAADDNGSDSSSSGGDAGFGLFSLTTGARLPIDIERHRSSSHIAALQFARLPDDRMPSLFVGRGPVVEKYSLVDDPSEDCFPD